jgi:hypothetical protein
MVERMKSGWLTTASLVIGVTFVVGGCQCLRIDRCLDSGGQWDYKRNECVKLVMRWNQTPRVDAGEGHGGIAVTPPEASPGLIPQGPKDAGEEPPLDGKVDPTKALMLPELGRSRFQGRAKAASVALCSPSRSGVRLWLSAFSATSLGVIGPMQFGDSLHSGWLHWPSPPQARPGEAA